MKLLPTLLIATALGTLPVLTSCSNADSTPLPDPSKSIPNDDGTAFRPGRPIADDRKGLDDKKGGGGSGNRIDSKKDPSMGSQRDVDSDTGGSGPNSPVPEPGTLLLVGTGLAGLAVLRRRRRRWIEDEAPAS